MIGGNHGFLCLLTTQLRRKIELDPLFAPQTTNVRNKVSRNIATELLQTVEHRNIDDTII